MVAMLWAVPTTTTFLNVPNVHAILINNATITKGKSEPMLITLTIPKHQKSCHVAAINRNQKDTMMAVPRALCGMELREQ